MSSLFALLIIFALGRLLAGLKIFSSSDSDFLQRLCFYVAFPALATLSFQKANLHAGIAIYPLISILVFFLTLGAGLYASRRYQLERPSRGTFLIASAMMNSSFVIPFVVATRGDSGLALAMLFDFGNGLMIFSVGYYLAVRYGQKSAETGSVLRQVLMAPPLWGLFFGTFLNLSGLSLPEPVQRALELTGGLMVPSYMLALGIRFSPKIVSARPVLQVIGLRMAGGLACGFLLSTLFGLDPASRAVVVAMSAAPSGFNTLTFSLMTGLDVEFAASIVSCSLVAGIVFLPLILSYAG